MYRLYAVGLPGQPVRYEQRPLEDIVATAAAGEVVLEKVDGTPARARISADGATIEIEAAAAPEIVMPVLPPPAPEG